ncbi:MAG: glycosyltransferase family 39 protein, partial [Candidatus Promineofilum sp.]|nr:glycosyltransferase family 39 protein [Promineifilum sp.]
MALFLRLRGLDTTGLWGDQAFTLNTAMRWVNGGPLPLAANKSSVGFVNPPLIEYLYGAALFLWRDILSVSLLTLLGGLAAVAVTGAVTARLFGRRAALWAMLAFAAAPWAVFWSQLIWNQTLVPPFAALALGGLLLYLFDRPRAIYLIGCFAATAAMIQLHPGSAVQLLTIALALLFYRRRVRPAHVVAGAAVFALLFLPYLLYQIGTGWADLAAVRGVAGQEAAFSSAALRLSLDLIRAQGLYRAAPGVELFDALATGLFVVALGIALWIVVRGFRTRRGQAALPVAGLDGAIARDDVWRALSVVLLWVAAPVVFYLRSSVYLQNYYLVGQWPAHFVLLGIGVAHCSAILQNRGPTSQRSAILQDRAPDPIRSPAWRKSAILENRATLAGWLVALPLVALLASQVFFSLRYQDARALGDGPPLQVRHARALIAQSNRLLAERPDCRLVGLGHGERVDNSDLALLVEFT